MVNSVFICGSHGLERLPEFAKTRLDSIMAGGMRAVVGGYNATDAVVQDYLAAAGYRNVEVRGYGYCKHNKGGWPKQVTPRPKDRWSPSRLSEYYVRFYEDCDYCLALWDGLDALTHQHVREMTDRGKPTWLYYVNTGKAFLLRDRKDAAVNLRFR